MGMRFIVTASAIAAVSVLAGVLPAAAQTNPQTPAEVARPGGDLPGDPKIALVKVADGFNDPVSAVSANDGTGRIFVVERVGKVKIVTKDGKINDKLFLDLTKNTPLGTRSPTTITTAAAFISGRTAFSISARATRVGKAIP